VWMLVLVAIAATVWNRGRRRYAGSGM